ncbi:hypothetical protein HK414_15865 [Ramlibacter terrae]|uniref:Uncharacterized protein n=1 Tax=Ramlibacter terrae TaxID=2732511 RepID=A0ABX6P5H1_9BURK|nr:hypothetical protein HK414_15865 [Ramlibacter terrae]
MTDAVNVTFSGTVAVNGNVTVNATGTVTFKEKLTLGSGGKLTITGGAKVVFADDVAAGSGDVTIDARSLTASGGVGSFTGTGEFILRASTGVMVIGDGTASSSALRVTSTVLQALGSGFEQLTLGKAGSGTVTLAGKVDVGSKPSALSIPGATVSVQPKAAITLGGARFHLQGKGDLLVQGSITSRAHTDISLLSTSGAVKMSKGTKVHSMAGDIALAAANGIGLSLLDARGAKSSILGRVTVDPGRGTVNDVNASSTVDVYALSFSLYTDADAPAPVDLIEVSTSTVYIDGDGGKVLRRESGTNARMHYAVQHGTTLHAQMTTPGYSTLVSRDPAIATAKLASVQSTLLPVSGSDAASSYLMELSKSSMQPVTLKLLDPDASYAAMLEQGWVVGSPGTQPRANGTASADPVFDYWVEAVEL